MLDYGEHGEDTQTEQVDITTTEDRTWPARLDTFSTYRSRFDIRTRRLCHRLLLFHRFEALSGTGAPPRLVRSLDLEFDEQPNVTLLTSATARGYIHDSQTGFYDVESLPPVSCSYTPRTLGQTLQTVDTMPSGTSPPPVKAATVRRRPSPSDQACRPPVAASCG